MSFASPENSANKPPVTPATSEPMTPEREAELDARYAVATPGTSPTNTLTGEQRNYRSLTKEMVSAGSLNELRDILTHFDAPKKFFDPMAGEISVDTLKEVVIALDEAHDGHGNMNKALERVAALSPKAQEVVTDALRKSGLVA